jgi:hypothetical protein
VLFGSNGIACHLNAGATVTISYATPKPANTTCADLSVTNTAVMTGGGSTETVHATHTVATTASCPTIVKSLLSSPGNDFNWQLVIANTALNNVARNDIVIADAVASAVSGNVTATATASPVGSGTCTGGNNDNVFGSSGDTITCDVNANGTLTITFSTPKPSNSGTCETQTVTNTAIMTVAGTQISSSATGTVPPSGCAINSALVPNPNFQRCTSADIQFVLDASGSIGSDLANMQTSMTTVATNVEAALPGSNWRGVTFAYPSSAGVFNNSGAWSGDPAALNTLINNMVSSGYTPTAGGIAAAIAGGTNDAAKPNLMIIVTDGDPNVVLNGAPTDYVGGANSAIAQADAARAGGWDTIVVMFGPGDSGKPAGFPTAFVLQQLAGPNVITPAGVVYSVANGTGLKDAIVNALLADCTPNIEKSSGTANVGTGLITWTVTVNNPSPSASTQTFTVTDTTAGALLTAVTGCQPTIPALGAGPWACKLGPASGATLTVTTPLPANFNACLGGSGDNTVTLKDVTGLQIGTATGHWTLALDQQACTGTLKIVKNVTNDNGGAKVVGDFGIATNAGALSFGAGVGTTTKAYTSNTLTVNAGTYTLTESNVAGYTEGTWSCTGNAGAVVPTFSAGSVVVAAGENVTCSITNNDDAGHLTIVKNVTNDNGGTKVVGDFGITTNAGALTFGAGVVTTT